MQNSYCTGVYISMGIYLESSSRYLCDAMRCVCVCLSVCINVQSATGEVLECDKATTSYNPAFLGSQPPPH